MVSLKYKKKSILKVDQEIKKGELELENLINKYRMVVITILFIGDVLALYFSKSFNSLILLVGIPGLLLAYFAMYKIHKVTQINKPKPALKYLTLLADYLFITLFVFELVKHLPDITPLLQSQVLLFATVLYLIVSLFSALRIHKYIIIISNIAAMLLNIFIHYYFGSNILVIVYTSIFIFVVGVFNIFIGGFIYDFYSSTYQLNQTMVDLGQASEEIKTQNDELATQNDYLAEQRNEIQYQNKQITASIEYASRIQKALIGSTKNLKVAFPESFNYFKPRDIVSGDFFFGIKSRIWWEYTSNIYSCRLYGARYSRRLCEYVRNKYIEWNIS